MIGLLIYNRSDSLKNTEYVNWLTNVASDKGIDLQLVIKEDFIKNGVPSEIDFNFVINRTRSYNISLLFELNNIRVFNESDITLLGNNKLAAYYYASRKSFIHPKILLSWSNSNKTISKPVKGHGGRGVGLTSEININDGTARLQQEFVENIVGDIRFYIIDNKIINAVLRTSNSKIASNFSQGGNAVLYDFDSIERGYVESFISNLSIDYAGVDFLLTRDRNLIFNEIEDVAGSRMLSELGVNNTTELFLEHILQTMRNRK